MKKYTIIAATMAILSTSCVRQNGDTSTPAWLESDSIGVIDARIAADFTLSRDSLAAMLGEKYDNFDPEAIDSLTSAHYLESKVINGEQLFHRKSVRNFGLLCPVYNGGSKPRGASASSARISYVDSVLLFSRGQLPDGGAHKVIFRFSVDVPSHPALDGDTLKVWMPLPLDSDFSARQSCVEILSAYPSDYILSEGKSLHNTIFFEAPAPISGDTAHFEYTGSFVTSGSYMSAKDIEKGIKPYDKFSEVYTCYTQLPEGRHIVRLDSLAKKIVGDETDPFKQSELVYDYIIARYPWAGAREYSTIHCIPEYVLREGHGDCGQVSLLYISLMRSLGVPARWESGWMLHPGEKNLHDWAEVYFEGIGWLPVDVSFGRYIGAEDPEAQGFYSHGIDSHRFASNKGVGDELFPRKTFVRSETVDFQLGEVETSKGNLYYPAWDSHLELISVEPIELNQ